MPECLGVPRPSDPDDRTQPSQHADERSPQCRRRNACVAAEQRHESANQRELFLRRRRSHR